MRTLTLYKYKNGEPGYESWQRQLPSLAVSQTCTDKHSRRREKQPLAACVSPYTSFVLLPLACMLYKKTKAKPFYCVKCVWREKEISEDNNLLCKCSLGLSQTNLGQGEILWWAQWESTSVHAKEGDWNVSLPATACVGSMAAIVIICTEIRKESEVIKQGII